MSGIVAAIAGAGAPLVRIENASVFASNSGGVSASYSLRSSGDLFYSNTGGSLIDQGEWIKPQLGMSQYDVRVSLTGDALAAGTADGVTWENLGTNRTWTLTAGVSQVKSATLTFTIRHSASGVTVDTATITLDADGS